MLKKLIATAMISVMGVSGAMAGDFSSMSWDDIVAQAKQEGQVSWFVWYFQDDFRAAVKPFEEKYGIKVTIPEGTFSGNLDKLMAERNREVGDIDVMSHDWSGLAEMDVKGLYMNMDGILPDAADKFSSVNGINSNGYAYAYWGNQTGIAYDPAKVDEANLPQTPADFAAFWVANPNMFGFNYENGGSGPSFYENTLRNLSDADFTSGTSSPEKIAKLDAGIKFFNDHASHYIITASNTDSLTRLSDGELSMVAAWEDHLAGLQRKGEVRKDLKFYIPKMGMNGGGNNVSIPKNAKNKAAALVFINWLTSADVQTGFNKQFGSAPMNRKADDSAALVRADQRENRVGEAINPFRADMEEYFIEKVILAR